MCGDLTIVNAFKYSGEPLAYDMWQAEATEPHFLVCESSVVRAMVLHTAVLQQQRLAIGPKFDTQQFPLLDGILGCGNSRFSGPPAETFFP